MGLNKAQKRERSEYLEKNLTITECSQGDPYIFVSYASDNWETVFETAVVPLQRQYGLRVYADKAFDNVNDKWIVPMLRNVRGADVVVAFVSQSYIESYACFLELLTAVNNRKQIVFVSLEEGLRLGKTTDQPVIERGVKNEIINQGSSLSTNTNNTSNDIMRAMKSAFTSINTLLEQDVLSKYDISDAFINFFRDASVNKKTLNDLTALEHTIESLSGNVFDASLISDIEEAETRAVEVRSDKPHTAETSPVEPKPAQAPSAAAATAVRTAPAAVENTSAEKGSNKIKVILIAAGAAVLAIAAVFLIVFNTPKDVRSVSYTIQSIDTSNKYTGIYTGKWLRGQPHGRGIIVLDNGAVYDCEWRDGLPNGHGTSKLPNGDNYNGNWKDGRFDGQGLLTYSDGSFYNGEFKDGKPNGQGSYTDADGTVKSGMWEDGIFMG